VPHRDDRRITLAVLTPAGRDLFEKIHPSHLARIDELMSALSAEEQWQLADLLGRLADRASEMDR
jgi:MarR family 2-MHQ and catechol resistance regulon transcriptional repressor